MNTLFDIELDNTPKEKYSGERCKNCANFYVHAYSRKLTYCSAYRAKGTAYNHKKVKRNDKACQLFKLKQP